MGKLYNLARMTTATTGTGNITLGAAVSGYLTFGQAGVQNGDTVSYGIKDGGNSEVGTAPYNSAGPILGARAVTRSTNGNAAISLSGAAEVFITARAEDIVGRLARQILTASGTYTPTPGMVACVIECVGAGGGGGGAQSVSGNNGAGAGGGGGGYSRTYVAAAAIGASQTVTIGAAGTAGTTSGTAGGAGGDTSVGSLCIAKGGLGGAGEPGGGAFVGAPGAGGTTGTGDFTTTGSPGQPSLAQGNNTSFALAGNGGSSTFGGGGKNGLSQAAGGSATGYGGGGAGAASYNGAGNFAGGAGAAGVVIITEYLNN
jgi:hypothetical protein